MKDNDTHTDNTLTRFRVQGKPILYSKTKIVWRSVSSGGIPASGSQLTGGWSSPWVSSSSGSGSSAASGGGRTAGGLAAG